MKEIGLAMDYPALDELLIFKALLKRDVRPVLLFPYADLLSGEDFKKLDVVINRIQHRYRRLRAAEYASAEGARCFNPFTVEYFCRSKTTMKKAFDLNDIPTASWFLTEHPLAILKEGQLGWNREHVERISRVIDQTIGYPIIVKATEGSRGSALIRINKRTELCELIQSQVGKAVSRAPASLYSNPENFEGFFIEQFLPHPFDLRCLVSFIRGEYQFLGCLARVGSSEAEISKSTVYNFIPADLEAPESVRALAIEATRAAVAYMDVLFGREPSDLLVGVDILAVSPESKWVADLYSAVQKAADFRAETELALRGMDDSLERCLERCGRDLERVWQDERMMEASKSLDSAYSRWRIQETHAGIQKKILRILETAELYVSELNSRIDFGRITRPLSLPHLHETIVDLAIGEPVSSE